MQDGRIDARGLITKRIRLEELVEGGFDELIEHKDRHAKILVQP
jgi:(R,R)-butanediol dehydrogenase / meso-butanediol dehydrogenase / diacetyl reductase